MSSQTIIDATLFSLQEWAAQIRECQNRPAGMSVVEWCACNGITKTNCYYRLCCVRKACFVKIPHETTGQQIVPVEPLLLKKGEHACSYPGSELDIRIKGCSIHVTEKTSMKLLAAVLEVVWEWPRNPDKVRSSTPQQFRWLKECLTITPRKSVKTVEPPEYIGWLCEKQSKSKQAEAVRLFWIFAHRDAKTHGRYESWFLWRPVAVVNSIAAEVLEIIPASRLKINIVFSGNKCVRW